MALGECGYRRALPFLKDIAATKLEATMIYIGLGDAIVRLSRESETDMVPVLKCARSGNDILADGAFRAMAMMRMVPEDRAIAEIIDLVAARGLEDGIRFWGRPGRPRLEGPQGRRLPRLVHEELPAGRAGRGGRRARRQVPHTKAAVSRAPALDAWVGATTLTSAASTSGGGPRSSRRR